MYKQALRGAESKTTPMQVVKTVLADDHPLYLTGLENSLTTESELSFRILNTFNNGKELLDYLSDRSIDLLILDLSLQELDGMEVIKAIRAEELPIRILVLSRYCEKRIIKSAMLAGANGFLLKTGKPQEIFTASQEILNGQTYLGSGVELQDERILTNGTASFEDKFLKKYHLTKREIQILRLITEAKSNKEIAQDLFISDQTVGVHRKNIMRKIGVSNTAGLIKIAYDYCLV